MKQKTAVEWLIEKLHDHSGHIDILDVANLNGYWEQAIQMEKDQHGKTWDKALDQYESRGHLYERAWTDFDEYYRETYLD